MVVFIAEDDVAPVARATVRTGKSWSRCKKVAELTGACFAAGVLTRRRTLTSSSDLLAAQAKPNRRHFGSASLNCLADT
jgi:hypothetical protein